MALIKCPECGKEISDKSDKCIHCGYPIKKTTTCIINGTEYNLDFVFDESLHKAKRVGIFRQLCKCSLKTAADIVNEIIEKQEIPRILNLPIEQTEEENIPHCPTCNSTSIKKIGALERGTSVVMWGLFSKKINKSFKCKNCGHTW